MKILLILLLTIPPIFAADIQKCENFNTEYDCKQNESNNCTWVSGEEECISKRKFQNRYNRKNIHSNNGYYMHGKGNKHKHDRRGHK